MRDTKEILADIGKNQLVSEYVSIEVLLDIRELLKELLLALAKNHANTNR